MVGIGSYGQFDFSLGYELINGPPSSACDQNRDGLERCNEVFNRFEELRGRVIGRVIRVEWAMSTVIQYYFCPTINRDGREVHIGLFGPSVSRNAEFIDIVLFQETCTFETKLKILQRVVEEAGIQGSIRKSVQPIGEDRNRLAHRKVGIDFRSPRIRLWNSRNRAWEDLEDDFEQAFANKCTAALSRIQEIGNQIEYFQIHGNPKDEIAI